MTEQLAHERVSHSAFGASRADKWMNCHGYVNLLTKLEEQLSEEAFAKLNETSPEAAEGTVAHMVAAKCLESDAEPWEFSGQEIEVEGHTITVDTEMVEGVSVYVDAVKAKYNQYAELGAKLYVEVQLSSILDDDAYGTADAIIFVPGERILQFDLKYGRGVLVEPDSAQNKEYAYFTTEHFDCTGIKVVECYIAQPRIPHPKGLVRKHVTNPKELEEFFVSELLPAMAESRKPNANLSIGDWCRFCEAKTYCPALKKETTSFSTDIDPSHMTGEELGDTISKLRVLSKYQDSLLKHAFERAMKGDSVKDMKIVYKKSTRVWKTGAEDKLTKKFGPDAYQEQKLKTPPMLEKVDGGASFVRRYAFSPDTGYALAPMTDSRPEIKLTGEEQFSS